MSDSIERIRMELWKEVFREVIINGPMASSCSIATSAANSAVDAFDERFNYKKE